jgi:hypothetical protein
LLEVGGGALSHGTVVRWRMPRRQA